MTEYLLYLLKLKTICDPFCVGGCNKVFTENQVQKILEKKFVYEDLIILKQAVVSLTSMAWAFSYDTHFANAMNIHGPYNIGNSKQMLIREYKFDWITEIWSNAKNFYDCIKIYQIFNNKDISIDWELHLETKSEFRLEKYLVTSIENGDERIIGMRELKNIVEKSTIETAAQVAYVNSLPVLDKIRKGALLVYLQTKNLALAIGENWYPGNDVEEAIVVDGENNWFGSSIKVVKPKKILDNWITIFDPRVPKD